MPETADSLTEAKAACGYRDPPAELADSVTDKYLGEGSEWRHLHAWFREHTSDGDEALMAFIAERYGQTLGEVYVSTDSYMKRSDPEYANYN